jgi:hypothetical protein
LAGLNLGSLLSPVVGAIGSMFGASQANQASAASVQQQENFQEQMSDTSYQRGMADMKAAGLNPMLAYAQGGASSPSGASYTAQNVASALPTAAGQVQSGIQAGDVMANIESSTASNTSAVELNKSNEALNAAKQRYTDLLSQGQSADNARKEVMGHLWDLVPEGVSNISNLASKFAAWCVSPGGYGQSHVLNGKGAPLD